MLKTQRKLTIEMFSCCAKQIFTPKRANTFSLNFENNFLLKLLFSFSVSDFLYISLNVCHRFSI